MESPEAAHPPGPRTRKGRRTQRQLLVAARRVFEQRGYFETRVQDIVQEGEVALGSFYRYFENKEGLLLALLEEVTAELYEATHGIWDQEQDAMTNLQRTTESYLQAYKRNGPLIRAMMQMAAVSAPGAAAWWKLRQRTYEQMAAHLPPELRDRPDGYLLVSALGGAVEQFARHWYVEAAEYGHAEPDPVAASRILARVWYGAVYTDAR